MRHLVSTVLLSSIVLAATPSVLGYAEPPAPASIATLRAGFANPPAEARLRCYWWWLNGHTDKPTILRDLEEMKAKGYGGALLVDADGSGQEGNSEVTPGPMFGSKAWVELYTYALEQADRLGLEITLNINSGWNLGGPNVKPEDASKLLTFTAVQVRGGDNLQLRMPPPPSKLDFYRDIALLAYPLRHGKELALQVNDATGDAHTRSEHGVASSLAFRSAAREAGFSMPDTSNMLIEEPSSTVKDSYVDALLSEVRDVSSSMQPDGTVHLNLPVGEWELLRVGYTASGAHVSTSSGKWQGLAIDHLSRTAFVKYWNENIEPLLVAAKPYHSLKYLATDSWELGGTNWTDDFRRQFQQRRGYDPVLYLPVVAGRIIEGRSQSTRFLTDLRRTVADLVSTQHYDVFAEMAAAHHLGVQAESGGPHGAPIDALETFRHAAVPQTEFWAKNQHRATDRDRFFTKEAASAANIYGQRYIAQEGETSIGPQWSESLASDLKPSFDMGITEGMNRLVWHAFTSSPTNAGIPGQEYFAGTHLNPQVTWWQQSRPFLTYLNRVQFMMQQGTAVNDVLYFYGDNIPNFVRLKADDPAKVLPGYDYDVTDEDALLQTIHIEGKELVGPSGVHWKVLVLPKTRRISLGVLKLTEQFLHAGGTVVSMSPESPTGNVSQDTMSQFETLRDRLWGGCSDEKNIGRGRLFCDGDARRALAAMHLDPDVSIKGAALSASSAQGVDYIHRQNGNDDIYFLRNADAHPTRFMATFRAKGEAEFWDPVTGAAHKLEAVSEPSGEKIALSLPAYGSGFVIFLPKASANYASSEVRRIPIQARWKVIFPASPLTNPTTITMEDLHSWTKVPELQYFSGTATYTASVRAPELKPGEIVCLAFSDVREIAEVSLNGQKASTVWSAPYESCVGIDLREGENRIEVHVTNLWWNAMVGRARGMDPEHKLQTNIQTVRSSDNVLESGLIGSASWVIYSQR